MTTLGFWVSNAISADQKFLGIMVAALPYCRMLCHIALIKSLVVQYRPSGCYPKIESLAYSFKVAAQNSSCLLIIILVYLANKTSIRHRKTSHFIIMKSLF